MEVVYLRAYAENKEQTRGWKGIEFGGNTHLLEVIKILKPILEDNAVNMPELMG